MKKIEHPEFTITGVIMIIVGLAYAYIGYLGEGGVDYGTTGIGCALISTGSLVLQKFRVGTVMMIVIFLVLAGSRILFHTEGNSIWVLLRLLLGVLAAGSIVYLQFRYHHKKKQT